jgi:predicted DNA-binding protein
MTTVQIPDEIAHQYEYRARAAGCDTNTFIREALIAQLEDLEDIEIAIARLSDPKPSLSLEEVKRNLGLDD